MKAKEKIAALQALMKKEGIDGYLIPSSDPHMSEYLPDHYAARSWFSGFNGSAGTSFYYVAFGYNYSYLGEAARDKSGAIISKPISVNLSRVRKPGRVILYTDNRDHSINRSIYFVVPKQGTTSNQGFVWSWHGGPVTTAWVDGHVTTPRVNNANPYVSDPFRNGCADEPDNYFSIWQ